MSVHPGSEWLDVNWLNLRRTYTRWVAADKKGFVIDAGSYPELIHKLNLKKVKLPQVTIACIHPGIVQ